MPRPPSISRSPNRTNVAITIGDSIDPRYQRTVTDYSITAYHPDPAINTGINLRATPISTRTASGKRLIR